MVFSKRSFQDVAEQNPALPKNKDKFIFLSLSFFISKKVIFGILKK
jgi:hypothetical protein